MTRPSPFAGLLVGLLALLGAPRVARATTPDPECAGPPASAAPVSAAPVESAPAPSPETSSTELRVPLPGSGGGEAGVTIPSVSVLTEILVLRRDGLGLVRFCDDAATAVAAVAALLGPPDDDTGWVDPLTIGSCPGRVARRVTWGSLDLYLGDESRYASGPEHLYGYSYGDVDGFEVEPAGLATPEGIGPGTPVTFLEAAYPGLSLVAGEEGVTEPAFSVDESLGGLVTDVTDEGVVTLVVGGEACGV